MPYDTNKGMGNTNIEAIRERNTGDWGYQNFKKDPLGVYQAPDGSWYTQKDLNLPARKPMDMSGAPTYDVLSNRPTQKKGNFLTSLFSGNQVSGGNKEAYQAAVKKYDEWYKNRKNEYESQNTRPNSQQTPAQWFPIYNPDDVATGSVTYAEPSSDPNYVRPLKNKRFSMVGPTGEGKHFEPSFSEETIGEHLASPAYALKKEKYKQDEMNRISGGNNALLPNYTRASSKPGLAPPKSAYESYLAGLGLTDEEISKFSSNGFYPGWTFPEDDYKGNWLTRLMDSIRGTTRAPFRSSNEYYTGKPTQELMP